MGTITTSECEECMYSTIVEESKKDVWIYCSARDKRYRFGQCVPCEDMEKIKK